jgi:hypothetical protein
MYERVLEVNLINAAFENIKLLITKHNYIKIKAQQISKFN